MILGAFLRVSNLDLEHPTHSVWLVLFLHSNRNLSEIVLFPARATMDAAGSLSAGCSGGGGQLPCSRLGGHGSVVMETKDWAVRGKAGTRRDLESKENLFSHWE